MGANRKNLTRCKNLETGVIAYHNCEGKYNFLAMQPKPHMGKDGKIYADGVWVAAPEKKMSADAAKIVETASEPSAKPAQ